MTSIERDEAAAPRARLELVVAVSENDVIGRANGLPWHLPADLRRFKMLTLGRHILMGRRTYESIGKALPGRTNLVLTRSQSFAPPDCTIVGTVDAARRMVGPVASPGDEAAVLMVIGGARVYEQCLPLATKIHLTLVHDKIEDGDTFFAGWRDPAWSESFRERHAADDRHAAAYSFMTLERVTSA